VSAMLTEFTLANFKSYRKSSLRLGSLTLLIGANAAGKSNALEGLRFLSWLAQGQKLSSIQYTVNSIDQILRGRVDDLCHREESSFSLGCRSDSKEWNQLDIEIRVHEGKMTITYEQIFNSDSEAQLYETISMSRLDLAISKSPNSVWTCYYSPPFPKERGDGWRIVCDNQKAMFTQLDIPRVDKSNIHNHNSQFNEIQQRVTETVQEYQQALQSILFFNPIPAEMRHYSQKTDYQRLLEDGSNLSSVLFNLWENQPECQQAILNFIQSLPEQAIDGLDFLVGPRDEVMVRLSETFGNTQRFCEAPLLSDGTLRVLAIAAAMFSAAEGSLIVIEEIDNGIHPSRAKHLLSSIRDIAERRNLRVLISTHNPALMDAIPDAALGDVVFCYRDPLVGDSRLVRLGDLDEFPGLISQGSLGQLVTKGVVDRFIKSPHTPEDRKQRSIAWLKRLEEHKNE
jgi:predicted ATPase